MARLSRVPGWTPLWQDYEYRSRRALGGDIDVDVCVIGAGIGGISTAWHLAGSRNPRDRARGAHGWVGSERPQRRLRDRRDRAVPQRRTTPASDASSRAGSASRRSTAQLEVLAIADGLGVSDLFRRCGSTAARGRFRGERAPARGHRGAARGRLPRRDRDRGRPAGRAARPGTIRRTSRPTTARCSRRAGSARFAAGAEARACASSSTRPSPRRSARATARRSCCRRRTAACGPSASSSRPTARCPSWCPRSRRTSRTKRLHMVATAPTDARLASPARLLALGLRVPPPDARWPSRARRLRGPRRRRDRSPSARSRRPSCSQRLERHLRDELGVEAPVTHRWVGLVGYGPDERPLAGPVPGEDGLYVLGGYNGTGQPERLRGRAHRRRADRTRKRARCRSLRHRARP